MKRLILAVLVLAMLASTTSAFAARGGGSTAPYAMQTIVTNDTPFPLFFEGQFCSMYGGGSRATIDPGKTARFSCHNGQQYVAMRFVSGGMRCAVEYYSNNAPTHQVAVSGNLGCTLKAIDGDPWAAYTLDVH